MSIARNSLALALVSAALASPVFATDFAIDPAHSSVGFSVRHLVSRVSGSFRNFSGDVSLDEKKPEASKATLSIDAASIDTANEKRDGHLKSPDFFDVAKFPKITFASKKVSKDGDKYKLDGDLTMHGVTKPVSLEAEHIGTGPDMNGKTRAGFHVTGKLNRKDYGVNWNKVLDQGGAVLGDDVNLDINVEAVKK